MSDVSQTAGFGKKFLSLLKFFFFVIIARLLSICVFLLVLFCLILMISDFAVWELIFGLVLCAIGIFLFIFSKKMKEAHQDKCPNCFKWNAWDFSKYKRELVSSKDVTMKKSEQHIVFDKSTKKTQPKSKHVNGFNGIGRADTSDPKFHIEKTYRTVAGEEKVYKITRVCKYCGEIFVDYYTSRHMKK